jgi:hypothetical protein
MTETMTKNTDVNEQRGAHNQLQSWSRTGKKETMSMSVNCILKLLKMGLEW